MSVENCGLPDGVMHMHVEACYQAGVAAGRAAEREEIFEFLRAQADVQRGEPGDQIRRGAINHAADRVRDRRPVGRPEEMEGVPADA